MRLNRTVLLTIAGIVASAVFATTHPMHQGDEKPVSVPLDPVLNMSPQMRELIIRSCADCHSLAPHLPWYAHLPPVSWMLDRDMQSARRAMNLTLWSKTNGKSPRGSIGTLAAMCADVESGRMPIKNYLLLHPEAKMTKEEINVFCEWTTQQITRSKTQRAANGE